jgi:hypothetical protein
MELRTSSSWCKKPAGHRVPSGDTRRSRTRTTQAIMAATHSMSEKPSSHPSIQHPEWFRFRPRAPDTNTLGHERKDLISDYNILSAESLRFFVWVLVGWVFSSHVDQEGCMFHWLKDTKFEKRWLPSSPPVHSLFFVMGSLPKMVA